MPADERPEAATCARCGASPETFFRVWDPARNESVFLCGPCSADRAVTKRCSCCSGAGRLLLAGVALRGWNPPPRESSDDR
jgi:hypothetical protein